MSVWKEQQSDVKGIKKRLPHGFDFATQNLGKRSSKMKEDWKECKLGEVCEKITDGSHFSPKATEIGYPMFSVKDMQEYGFDYSNCKYISEEDFKCMKKNDCVPKKGDILVAKDGSFLKQIFECKEDKEEAILSSIAIFRPNIKIILPNFLCYLLKTPKIYNYIASNCVSGSALPRIVLKDFKNVIIPVPSLATQQKIAKILSSLDDKIELNNKINQNLEQQAQAIFKSWFVDFEPFGGKMPEGWKVGKLSDIADYYNGYAFSSKELLNEPVENCLDVFKQGHIKKGGGFISDGTKSWYPLSKCQKLKNYILKKGDILMAMTDMKGNVVILGNTAIMPVNDKYIVNQRVGLLRAKKELNIDYPYLYLLTNDHDFLMDLRSRANSGVQVNLSSTAIKESEVNIAPKEVYKQFNDIVLPLFEKILANQQENQKLVNIRDTLLPKLMNGEIEV